jgi:hypothetical protein
MDSIIGALRCISGGDEHNEASAFFQGRGTHQFSGREMCKMWQSLTRQQEIQIEKNVMPTSETDLNPIKYQVSFQRLLNLWNVEDYFIIYCVFKENLILIVIAIKFCKNLFD